MKTYLSRTLSVLGIITIVIGVGMISRAACVIAVGLLLLWGGARSARAPQPPAERPQGPHRFTPQGSA
jgi:uncharacterized SAM-binding protein YcdF (DUF218 family)